MDTVFKFAKSLPVEAICYGRTEKPAKKINLRAGKLTMIYEDGFLRTILIGKYEIIRMMYAAVRDKAWLTAQPEIFDEDIEIQDDSFQIKYKCRYQLGEIDFFATYSIKGDSDCSVSFEMEGEALSTFQKSRIGFCLLHPIEECAGNSCVITHNGGEKANSCFPLNISPAQPFKDIKSMEWEVPGGHCKVDFYGDVFETEDHRNWTDASFKTYCTPLEIPFPVTIQKGEKILQKIVLKVLSENFQIPENKLINQIVLFPEQLKPLPKIGVGQATRPQIMSLSEMEVFKSLLFDHYRIDLYLFNDDWKIKAEIPIEEAVQLDYPVMFALFLGEQAYQQANQFIVWVLEFSIKIDSIILFHQTIQSTPDSLSDLIAPLFKSKFSDVKIGAGTNANFAQLNRNRPVSNGADFISYSIHPQEHANDNQTLVENLQAQKYTVESVLQFAGGKEVWVSPVNIQRRFNDNLENFEYSTDGESLLPQVDARLMSLFGAGWSAISLKCLSESGVNGCTYFETIGERGLIQGTTDSRWPHEFPSIAGMIFPVFHIFRYVLANKDYQVINSQCNHPMLVDSFVMTNGEMVKLIIVNFSSDRQKIQILGSIEDLQIKILDIESFAFAASESEWYDKQPAKRLTIKNNLSLNAFSICFCDGHFKKTPDQIF